MTDVAVRQGVIRRMAQVSLTLAIQAAILFLCSGRMNWPSAWGYLGVYLAVVVMNALVLLPKNPELISERGQVKEGTKNWDRVLATLVSIVGPMASLVIAGFDARFGWSSMAAAWQISGLVLVAAGYLFFSWAMAANRFFAGVVRIQEERGHTTVEAGPYRLIRHPGYLGMIAYVVATPLALGSWWGLIPAGCAGCLIVLRTALEDKTLHRELHGYADFANRVKYRLVPGVW